MINFFKQPSLILAALTLLGINICIPPGHAEGFEQTQQILNQREQELSHCLWKWEVFNNEVFPSLPPKQLANELKAYKKQFEEKHLPELTRRQLLSTISAQSHPRVSRYREVWSFDTANEDVLTTGTIQGLLGDDLSLSFRQFNSGNNGILVCDMIQKADVKVLTYNPVVWTSQHDSFRCASPFQQGFDLRPEDFVMLLAKNPLGLYGSQWSLISSDASNQIYEAQVKSGNFSPFKVKIFLDSKRQSAVKNIQLIGHGWNYAYKTLKFREYQGQVIPASVDANWHVDGTVDRHRTWNLKNIGTSKLLPKSPVLNVLSSVADYRLLGTDLTTSDIVNADQRQDPEIVKYRWKGSFVDKQNLRSLQSEQDVPPTTGSGYRFAGIWIPGVLFVMMGIIWYRRNKHTAQVKTQEPL